MKAKTETELELFKMYGESLRKYATEIGRTIIIVGITEEEEKQARKKILKIADKLEKGNGKCIDEDAFNEYIGKTNFRDY